jgi:hypothetical protein
MKLASGRSARFWSRALRWVLAVAIALGAVGHSHDSEAASPVAPIIITASLDASDIEAEVVAGTACHCACVQASLPEDKILTGPEALSGNVPMYPPSTLASHLPLTESPPPRLPS